MIDNGTYYEIVFMSTKWHIFKKSGCIGKFSVINFTTRKQAEEYLDEWIGEFHD